MKVAANISLAPVCAILFAGCTIQETRQARYADPVAIVPGRAEEVTMYDLESSAQKLVQEMLSNPRFGVEVKAAREAKGRLPVIALGNIENKTGERVQGRLDATADTVRSALFASGLFDVKDDNASAAIRSRIVRGIDSGLENSSLLQSLGGQDAPDFFLLGDFRHFADFGGVHTYRLHLAIHNLASGKVLWEGIQTKVKL